MSEAVKTLLSSGADPNICSSKGNSPLQYAVEARIPESIQPLLDHGAIVDHCDIKGQTALHYAAIHQSDLTCYRPLIEAGADPNRATIPGVRLLSCAILEHHYEAVVYLVQNGADINLKGQNDRSPIFYAVEYNNHATLEFLHEQGADCTVASLDWPTIAHVAAHFADIETLHILSTFQLELDNIECVDRDGLSIPEIIDKRVRDSLGDDNAFVEAFSQFLRSVGNKSDNEEIFHDAMEEVATN